jgi:hypothetical protein
MTNLATILPPTGSMVRLIETPRGSWATAGEVYRVNYRPHVRAGRKGIHATTTVQLWDDDRDCGTYDSAMMWAVAKWELV